MNSPSSSIDISDNCAALPFAYAPAVPVEASPLGYPMPNLDPVPLALPALGQSLTRFTQRAERRSTSSARSRKPKPPPPTPLTTPVAKRTRSLKRSASIGDLQSVQGTRPISLNDASPDKTLVSLKTKQKKQKKKSVSPPSAPDAILPCNALP